MLSTDDKAHLRHVQLTLWECKFLEYMAEHAGEAEFTKHFRAQRPDVQMALDKLVAKQLATCQEEISVMRYRLTDEGRAVVSQLEKMRV